MDRWRSSKEDEMKAKIQKLEDQVMKSNEDANHYKALFETERREYYRFANTQGVLAEQTNKIHAETIAKNKQTIGELTAKNAELHAQLQSLSTQLNRSRAEIDVQKKRIAALTTENMKAMYGSAEADVITIDDEEEQAVLPLTPAFSTSAETAVLDTVDSTPSTEPLVMDEVVDKPKESEDKEQTAVDEHAPEGARDSEMGQAEKAAEEEEASAIATARALRMEKTRKETMRKKKEKAAAMAERMRAVRQKRDEYKEMNKDEEEDNEGNNMSKEPKKAKSNENKVQATTTEKNKKRTKEVENDRESGPASRLRPRRA